MLGGWMTKRQSCRVIWQGQSLHCKWHVWLNGYYTWIRKLFQNDDSA